MREIEKYLVNNHIAKLTLQDQMLKKVCSPEAFYQFYLEVFERFHDAKLTFEHCQKTLKETVGVIVFIDFENFNDLVLSKIKPISENSRKVLESQRNFLMLHFKEKGFKTWESFSPLILHYYPAIGTSRLKGFYNGTSLNKEVIQLVDFVRQIIG